MIDFYDGVDQLKYIIAKSLRKLINDIPAIGWIRADQVESTLSQNKNIIDIKRAIDDLSKRIDNIGINWQPISDEEIDKMFEEKKEYNKIPNLSQEARMLLTEACKDSYGQIIRVTSLEGVEIQTNNKVMIPDRTAKTIAKWEQALIDLQREDLVSAVGNKNEIFQVKKMGYDVNDLLDRQEELVESS